MSPITPRGVSGRVTRRGHRTGVPATYPGSGSNPSELSNVTGAGPARLWTTPPARSPRSTPVQMHRWDTRLRPPPLAERPVLWDDAADRKSSGRDGMPSRGQLRGPGWRRAGPGPADLGSRRRAASSPRRGSLSAARLRRRRWLGRGVLVRDAPARRTRFERSHAIAGPPLSRPGGKILERPGGDLSRERLPAADVLQSRDLTCTAPLRTAFDGSRLAPCLVEAVLHLDMLLTCGLVIRDELQTYFAEHPGWRGTSRRETRWPWLCRGLGALPRPACD